jgi:hypothetical protein
MRPGRIVGVCGVRGSRGIGGGTLRQAALASHVMLIPDFDTLLPRLASAYEQGRLVPFVGSGMSRRACSDWPTLIASLEVSAGLGDGAGLGSDTPRDVLIRKANNAVRTLKRGVPGAFAKAVRAALLSNEPAVPLVSPQMQALTRVWWPLALTTNYDNCYAEAFNRNFGNRQLAVVGRGAVDCQRVLTSLSTAGRSLLWALQGYLSDLPCTEQSPLVSPAAADRQALEEQLVVGHEEYRRVTYRDQHFRRAFAEVFRQRSLLFLGAGLQESYLQELFGEVLEFYGSAARPHYAFVQQGEVDPAFMLARFQIVVVEYPKGEHGLVQQWLDRLAQRIDRPAQAPVSWCWGRIETSDAHWSSVPELEVVRGPLPTTPRPAECLAVSAGGSGQRFFFSDGIRQVMRAWGVKEPLRPSRVLLPYLCEFGNSGVYGTRARAEGDLRNLSCVYDASLALFEHVAPRARCIRMQLLSTGGVDKFDATVPRYELSNFPERFSFIQTLRAWAAWRTAHPGPACRLVLHVVLESVYQDIASGRIDVLELLGCTDLRFFAEVVQDGGEIERRLFQTTAHLTLAAIAADLQLPAMQWQVKVTPPPAFDDRWFDLDAQTLQQTLQTMGVVPGSTLHFRQAEGMLPSVLASLTP